MDMSLDICFQWCLQYCFLSRSVGADAIRKDAFLVNTNKDFYRGFPISLHAFSVLFKKKKKQIEGKKSFVEDTDTQTQGQTDSQNSIWEGTDSVSNKKETGKEKTQEERSKGFKPAHSLC